MLRHFIPRNDNRVAAFTLAEVLITLTIIGVIAALTIPTLIGKYEKHQTVVGLKKVYSEVGNAIRMSVAENGDVSSWDWSQDEAWLNKYILPYFKIVNTMSMQEAKTKAGGTYYQISGQPEIRLGIVKSLWPSKIITLPSGAQIWLGYNKGVYRGNAYDIYTDINGPKKPNTFGKDIFPFHLWQRDGKLTLNSNCDSETEYTPKTINELKNGSLGSGCYSYQCNKNSQGVWCGALIQAEGWQIKDDYPW